MKIYITVAIILSSLECTPVGMLSFTTGKEDFDSSWESACDEICVCYGEKSEHLKVNCSSRNLTKVPFNIPDSVVYLNLSSNHLRLAKGDFVEYERLQILNLQHNHLLELPRIFHPLEGQRNNIQEGRLNIRLITFNYNHLSILPEDLFDGVTLLDTIEFDFNNIIELPEMIFANLIRLRTITLCNNRIQKLPERLFRDNTDVWSISLRNNKLITLPQNLLINLNKLEQLDVSGNLLHQLPEFLLKYSRFASFLYFSENRLQTFQNTVFPKGLKIFALDISHNNLTSIPEDMFKNVRLRDHLDMSNNHIKALPTHLFHWEGDYHDLKYLFLNYNQLTFLQRNIFIGLYQLKTLCLFGNKIAAVEPLVFAIDTLETVYLFNNEIVQLSYGWFTENSTTAIHVYGNKIQHIYGKFVTKVRNNNTLYINCSYLNEVQRMMIKMTCVTPSFTPGMQLILSEGNKQVAKFFQKEGFTCHENATASNISCKACPRGTYSNGDNECIHCPRGGFYQDEIGKKSSTEEMNCKKCPKGRFVVSGGGVSQEDCLHCPDGTIEDREAGFRACLCKDGFARRSRFGECYPCTQKGISCTGQDFQALEPGYFWSWNFSNASLSEYNKFVLNLRTENIYYDNNTCYFKDIPRAHKCLRSKSCPNDLKTSVESICATGHTGWLCNKCQKGFYSDLQKCFICPATTAVAFGLFLVLCIFLSFCFILCRQYEKIKNRDQEKKTQVNKVVSRAKLLLGFYQVVGVYLVSFYNFDWHRKFLIVVRLVSLFEMNVFNILIKSECFHWNIVSDAKFAFVMAVTVVLTITLIPIVYHLVVKFYTKIKHEPSNLNDRLTNMADKISFAVVILLFVMYLPVCKNIFQLYPWACKTFCLDQNDAHCFTVLHSDFDVQCDNHFRVYQVFAFVSSALYTLAFPLLLFYLLQKYFATSLFPKKSSNCLKNAINNNRRPSSLLSQSPPPPYLLFLCENYKDKYWYWEIVELTRKISQTVLIILFGWKDKLTVLLTIGICILFLTLDASLKPMKNHLEQILQTFSLTFILANALLLGVHISHEYQGVTSLVLAFLNMFLLVFIFVEILVSVILRVKHAILRSEKNFWVRRLSTFIWRHKTY